MNEHIKELSTEELELVVGAGDEIDPPSQGDEYPIVDNNPPA